MLSYRLKLLPAILLIVGSVPPAAGQGKGKAKIAVIQAEGYTIQDPFMADYDFAKVVPAMEAHLDRVMGLFEEAGQKGADLVCGPEDIQHIGGFLLYLNTLNPNTGEILFNSLAVRVPGPLTGRIADIARRHSMYVIAPLFERDGGEVFNTSVVFGRNGEILGKHRKTTLPVLESWQVSQGDEYKVFQLDFANVSIATCYEIMYPEISRIYALKGADIIFNPTAGKLNGPGQSLTSGFQYLSRARDNFVYIAPVTLGSDGNGIIDFNGHVVAEAVGAKNAVIMAEIDFSLEPVQGGTWWPAINGTGNKRAMHYLGRRPELYGILADQKQPILERYRDEKLTTGDREAQLEALNKVDYGP